MHILFELNLSVIRSIKGFPRIDKYSQTCIHRSLKGTWKYDRYEQLDTGYNNSTIHNVKKAYFHDTRLRQIYTYVFQLETISLNWRDRQNLTIKEEKGLNFVILLKRNPKNYVRQILFHLKLLRYVTNQFLQSWVSGSEECHKLSICKEYKVEFCVKKYLDFHIMVQLLANLRSDTLKLNVETGKYQNVARENRICWSFNMNALENKYHFVLVCPAYRYIITTLLFMTKSPQAS